MDFQLKSLEDWLFSRQTGANSDTAPEHALFSRCDFRGVGVSRWKSASRQETHAATEATRPGQWAATKIILIFFLNPTNSSCRTDSAIAQVPVLVGVSRNVKSFLLVSFFCLFF